MIYPPPAKQALRAGFTLLELSIVLALIAVIIGGGLVILNASTQAAQLNGTVAKMDAIDKAIFNFALANNRIPCPSDLLQVPGATYYGVEAAIPGTCTGGPPAATYVATSGAVEGGVPTRALRLPDDYMYDGWGRRFNYAADPTMTSHGALPVAPATGCKGVSSTAITVKHTGSDTTSTSRTTAGIYAILSHGANGHGAFTSGTTTPVSNGSTNTDELLNCHCDSTGASTGFTATYVEKNPTLDAASATDAFDDIVDYREAWQIQAQNFPLLPPQACVFVENGGNGQFEKFSTNGTYILASPLNDLSLPTRILQNSSGNLLVLSFYQGRIVMFDTNGHDLGTLGGWWQPYNDFAVDTAGNIWIAMNDNRIVKYSSSLSFILQVGCASGSCPTGSGNGQFNGVYLVSTDSNNNVWAVDGGNGRVEEFNSAGGYVSQFPASGISAITVDSVGNIWTVNPSGGPNVVVYNPAGAVVLSFGTYGDNPGQLDHPDSIAFDSSGNVWIADGARAQEFSSTGTYMRQFGSFGTGPGQLEYGQGILVVSPPTSR